MSRVAARGTMPSLRRRLAAAVALAVPGTAGASPWLVEPAVTLGVEHQTNPEFRVADGPSSTQGYVGVAFPAEWRDGRYGAQLSVGGTLRQASGSTSARDQSDFGVSAAASRGADQGSVGVSASFGQTNLLGANAPDVGLNRAAGSERRYSVGTRADWRPTEYDALALDLRWSRTDYDASAAAGLVGNDDATAALSYSRALRPNLQALATASAIEYRPDGSAPSSRSASLQAGLGWLPAAGWTLRATYGRSRVRFAGRSAPSDVYDLSVARQTEFGTVSFSASQSFQASPFGSIAKRRGYGGGYSRALSERLASTISASRTENTELFRGLSFTKRNTDEATIGVSYALDEPWQVAGQLRYTRESYPETVFLRRRPAADSVFAGVSLQRRFGRVSVL